MFRIVGESSTQDIRNRREGIENGKNYPLIYVGFIVVTCTIRIDPPRLVCLCIILPCTYSVQRSRKPRLTTVGIRCADNATPSILKSCH
jgi:hypothetical protein